MKILLITIFVVCSFTSSLAEFDAETKEGIDFLAELFRVPNQSPGLGLTVVHNGNTYSTGYGVRDRERDLPVDKDTRFLIASTSKGFTSIIAAKIASEKFPTLGEAVLDTPVIQLVPNVNFTFIDRNRHESMTLRDFLSHRTCLETSHDTVIFNGGGFEDPYDYNYRSRYLEEICPFRSQFVYNNAMYDLAGQIIGFIAGKPFKEVAREFFAELGMTRTDYASIGWNIQENTAKAYYWTVTDEANPIKLLDPSLLDRFAFFEGTGGIVSCSSDMEKYVNFHINKGKVGDKQVLPENVLNWVYKPSMNNYALGFEIGNYFDESPIIGHGGNIVPFEGFFAFLPHHNLGIYSVINGPGALTQGSHVQLHFAIYELLLLGKKNKDLNVAVQPNINLIENSHIKNFQNSNNLLKKNIQNTEKFTNTVEKLNSINFVGLFGSAIWGNIVIGWDGSLYTFAWGNYAIANLHQFVEDPNYYWIEWTTDNESYLEAFLGAGNVPPYFIHIMDIDTLIFNSAIIFKRDATRETFPEIPWQ